MIKLTREKTFTAFTDFQQTAKVFPTNFNTHFQYAKFKLFCSYFQQNRESFPCIEHNSKNP